jgi:hypothetical protein
MSIKLKVGIAGYGVVGKRRRDCVEKNLNLTLKHNHVFAFQLHHIQLSQPLI